MIAVQYLKITDEVLGFFISAFMPEQLVAFHASNSAQDRLRMLLDINRNGTLTAEEKAELDEHCCAGVRTAMAVGRDWRSANKDREVWSNFVSNASYF